MDAFKPSSRSDPLYVAVVQYSKQSRIEVDKLVRRGSDEIRTDVNSIIQLGSGTKTYSGLQFVNDNVYPNMRRQSFKILITMTDGKVKEARNANTINQARSFYNMMVAVGVGSVINRSELLDFSSTGSVFNVTNFAALEGIISVLVGDICFRLGQIVTGEFLYRDSF